MRRLIRFSHWSILDFKVLQETKFSNFSIFLFLLSAPVQVSEIYKMGKKVLVVRSDRFNIWWYLSYLCICITTEILLRGYVSTSDIVDCSFLCEATMNNYNNISLPNTKQYRDNTKTVEEIIAKDCQDVEYDKREYKKRENWFHYEDLAILRGFM